jgi:hypothetical protein
LTKDNDYQQPFDQIKYKYGSTNYYAVLHYDYNGDYISHENYIEDLRQYQIQYPIDINYKKHTNLCEKTEVKKKSQKQKKPNTNEHRKTVTKQYFTHLNAYDYTERVKNKMIDSNMSFLKKRETVLPQLEITPQVKSSSGSNEAKQESENVEWTTVGAKGTEMKFEEIFAATSTKYLPKNLPPGTVNTDITVNETEHQFPLMIKLNKLQHNKKFQLNHTRAVVAVLSAIQKICKETYIMPREGTGNLTPIKSPTQISMIQAELKMYMELPTEETHSKNSIIARIMIKSNVTLIECKAHPKFVEYLAKEHIVLDVNGLMDVAPEHVGYLEKITGRNETLEAHTARVRELLPEDFPPFQLNIHSLKVYEGRCKVFMINCDKINLERVRDAMVQLHITEKIRFMSWREFAGMEDTIRKVAIRKEIYFAKEYESLLINGFADNDDNITMKMLDPEELQLSFDMENEVKIVDPMEYTYVSDYIGSIKGGNGTYLFKHVYPPHKGMREVLVKKSESSEAKEFIEVLPGKLAKKMNNRAIELVFDNPETAKQEMVTSKWQPYSRAAEIMEECKQNNMLLNPAKRPRKSEIHKEKITKTSASKVNTIVTKAKVNNTQTVQETVVPNAWFKTAENNSIVTVNTDEATNNTVTLTQSTNDMKEFKATLREEIKMNNQQMKQQLQLELAEIKKHNKDSIEKLDEKIESTGIQMENKINTLSKKTGDSITNLEVKINNQTLGMENLTNSTNLTCKTIETQFDDIKAMFSQLMGNIATNMATRIKNLTTPKKQLTHLMSTRSKKTDNGEDMSFDSLDTSGSEIEFDEKICADESVEEASLK